MKKSETDDDGLFSRKGVECDAECARLERNRVLAEALQIEDPEDVIVSTVYDEDLLAFATEFPGWTSDIQSVISTFVHDRDQKHYYFPTKFRPAQNQFLIALSPVYNLFAELVDAGTGKGNVIYRKQGQEPRLPSRLLSEAVLARTHGEPESLEVMESSQDSLPDADVSGQVVNALIFFNLQLGLDPLVICSLVQAMVSLDIQLKPHSIESTTHCAIQFIPQSEVYKPPNALEMLIKESVLGPIRKRLVEIDRLVNDVQTCRITPTDEIIFKGKKRRAFRQQFASTSRGDSGVVSGRNPFSYLDESQ